MSCIGHNFSSIQLLSLQKHRQIGRTSTSNLSWLLSSRLRSRHCGKMGSSHEVPLKVGAFPTALTLAVAKPADTGVLLQTGGLLIFFYIVANFVVPQIITKNFGLDKEDENEKPVDSRSRDEGKASSGTAKRGFNSTKPK